MSPPAVLSGNQNENPWELNTKDVSVRIITGIQANRYGVARCASLRLVCEAAR